MTPARASVDKRFDSKGNSRLGRQPNHGDEIYSRLHSRILDAIYPTGGKLPSEPALCREFGVSRPVVREALARLRAEGLIVSRQGAGTFVQQISGPPLRGFPPVKNLKDIQDCFDFRIGLEGEAAFHAAANRDEADLEGLRLSWEALERAVGGGGSANDEDFEFHIAISRATRIHFFTSVITSMRQHIMVGINLADELSSVRQDQRMRLVRAEHEAIFAAIVEQDAERASAAMRRHLENTRRRLFDGA